MSEPQAVVMIQVAGIGAIQTLLATPAEERDLTLADRSLHRARAHLSVTRAGSLRVRDAKIRVVAALSWAHPDGYEVSTDPERLQVDRIHRFLRTAYWSPGVPRELVERAIAGSLPFGLYGPDHTQAGFARVVSDRATYAYLGDVFIEEPHRGRGLGVFLVECILAHPELQGLRRWALATADAHGLYARFGFRPPAHPERQMFIERAPSELWGSEPA